MSKTFFSLLSIIIIVFIGFSCQVAEPNNDQSLSITVEDVSCTETWIKISAKGIDADKQLMLYRNNEFLTAFTMDRTDTLFFDEGLLPSKTYSYKAKLGGFTAIADVVTMDTTSHDFAWQTFTFGGNGGSSYLKDVAIIDENNIWAVGEIYDNGEKYNAVHWNGVKWELRKIMFYIDPDQPLAGKTASSCESIFILDHNYFGISSNVQIARFNSNYEYNLLKMGFQWKDRFTITAMWGVSSEDFYVVGNNGNIAHYDGSPSGTGWKKIESGTELRFLDIYSNNGKIYCIAAELFSGINSELYEIKNQRAILDDGTNLGTSSVSVYVLKNKLYVFGYYRLVRTVGKIGWEEVSEPVNFDGYSKIRGNGYNDIVAAGTFGKIDHFNSVSWEKHRITSGTNNSIDFSSVAIKGNVVCAVGRNGVFIVIGRR